MFEIGKILKRAWQVLWNYKVLWIFGLLLVLTGAGSGGSGGGNSGYRTNYNETRNEFQHFNFPQNLPGVSSMPKWMQEMGTWAQDKVFPLFATPEKALHTGIILIAILFGFCIVLGLLYALVRYPSETAVMRMVDEHENTGIKVSFKEGWKLGWNHRAFRMWLVDLLVAIPGIIYAGIIAIFVLVNLKNAANFSAGNWAGFAGAIAGFILLTLVFVVFMIGLGLLREMVIRFVAIEDKTVGEAFASGWTMFKRNLGNLLITWLIMVVIGIGFGIVSILVFFILIPTYVIMAIPGAIVAAIPGAIGYGIASIFAASTWAPWVIGAAVALPFLITIMFLPLCFVMGWFTIFNRNVFTLAYRQFKLMASIPPMPAPVPPAVPPVAKQ